MSPELTFYTRGQLKPDKVDLPDKTGEYSTHLGLISLDMSRINPRHEVNLIRLMDRETMLSPEGIGSLQLNSNTRIYIKLHEPIRKEGEWHRARSKNRWTGQHVVWIPNDPSLRTESENLRLTRLKARKARK